MTPLKIAKRTEKSSAPGAVASAAANTSTGATHHVISTQRLSRQRLADAQAQVLAALLGGADAPAGFDPSRLAASTRMLTAKRRRSLIRYWPDAQRLLPDMIDSVRDYVDQVAAPTIGGLTADAYGLLEWLDRRRQLPRVFRRRLMFLDLRFRRVPGGLVPRRGPVLRLRRWTQPRAWHIGVRWSSAEGRQWLSGPPGS